jgi:hypothetical protein
MTFVSFCLVACGLAVPRMNLGWLRAFLALARFGERLI